MSSIDPLAHRSCTAPATESPRPPRRSTFSTILRTAARVAAVAVPVVGPAIDAISGAVNRSRIEAITGFGGTSETLKYLELQRAIEQETRAFETASNVMKARHDATMNSIRNLKS